MSLTDELRKSSDREQKASQYVPITHMVSPTVLETRSGELMSIIHLKGHAFDTESNEMLNELQRIWHQSLLRCGDSISLMVTMHRKKIDVTIPGEFSNALADKINQRYQSGLEMSNLFQNDWYMCVVSRGLALNSSRQLTSWLRSVCRQTVMTDREMARQKQLDHLRKTVNQLFVGLKLFQPRLLGDCDADLGYSECLAFISYRLNGGAELAVHAASSYPENKDRLKTASYPSMHVGQYCLSKRISFGQAIQFGETADDSSFAAMVSIKNYPSVSASIMLDRILRLPVSCVVTHHFLPVVQRQADTRIKRHLRKLQQVEDAAISQHQDMVVIRDDLASGRLAMCLHQNSIMVMSNDLEQLKMDVAQVIDCYQKAGLVAVREQLGQQACFWSQIPGNQRLLNRLSMITTKNFADLCSLHNYQTGDYRQNHLDKPVSLMRSLASTPVWVHCHGCGPKNNPASGHTMILGGNGSGKTVMMCFLEAQLSRFEGRSFCFDRDRGMEIYWRASGGEYVVMSPTQAVEMPMNPFQLDDTPENRQFCQQWLSYLLVAGGVPVVSPAVIEALNQCVSYCFDRLDVPHRSLRHAVALLPEDFPHWPELRRWLRSDGEYADGEYAYLFDHSEDRFCLSKRMGFDLSYYLDLGLDDALLPICLYLLHRIESTMKGQLVSIFIDEAWQLLNHPSWQRILSQWLPTLRKKNAHMIMATQSPHTVATSPIRHCILDNCATQMYFANPQAQFKDYCEVLGLSETQWQAIRANESHSRVVLYKQGNYSQLLQADLSSVGSYLSLMSATACSLVLMDQLLLQYGVEPKCWLDKFISAVAA